MIIAKMHLSRRAVLRGLGVSIALPLLDAMVPALTASSQTAASPTRRFGALYAPMGANMTEWIPSSEGVLELSPILEPLAPFREHALVVTGLDMMEAERRVGGAVHSSVQTTWLTGTAGVETEGAGIRAGTSMDQIVAKAFSQETQLGSIELSLESSVLAGKCELGYSCIYSSTIAWRTPTTPLPVDHDPRSVFERMFGTADSTDSHARLAYLRRNRSILDMVTEKARSLQKLLGSSDRLKMTEYLDAVRDVERRLQRAEEQSNQELPAVAQPANIPASYDEHAKLMADLLALGFQCDLTRVGTLMLGREMSTRAYPEIGIAEPHHPLSHHLNDPVKLAKQAKLNKYHLTIFAHLLEKLRSTPDGEGSLLDHTMLLYGSGMSNSNMHLGRNVPTVVVAGRDFQMQTGRHLRCAEGTPLANLQLALLRRLGIVVESFGDSTGELAGVVA